MGQLRIIGGVWKRTPIMVPDREGLRPTPDRVRETLFNWLGQNLSGWRCLDLFAGSGALGFEAGSRGAQQVVFVEPDAKAAHCISQLIEKLDAKDQLFLEKRRAEDYLTQGALFDLIFLDPPFGKGLIDQVMPKVLLQLAADGLIYVESDTPVCPEQAARWGLDRVRQDKAGGVHYHLLRKRNAIEGDANVTSSLSGDL